MIDFPCPHCSRKLKVPDERAGRKAKCPHCSQSLVIPSPAAFAQVPTAGPRPSPAQEPTTAPEDAPEGRRDTNGDADATGGLPRPNPEWTDFLAPSQGPGEVGRLGPYRVLKVLGAGGMGVVFQAEDPSLQRQVALKAMLPALAASASARERFLREARAAAAVEHDHIVAVYQVGEDRGVPYLAMPFLKGEPLDARLRREKRLPTAEVLRIARETAAGLEAARQRGLIHRDIKPGNLWLEEGTGRVKVLDFGLARLSADDVGLTQQGAILGTPAFMAPEQAGGKADHRSDLFSLGGVMYRMATGEPAFKGTDTFSLLMAVATEPVRPPLEVNPKLPPALSDLILRLLAKKPEDRPTSAQAVIEAIRAIETKRKTSLLQSKPAAPSTQKSGPQRSGRAPAPPRPTPPVAPQPARRGGGGVVLGLFTLLLIGGLGVGGYFVLPYLPFHPPGRLAPPAPPAPPAPDPTPVDTDKTDQDKGQPLPAPKDDAWYGPWRSLFDGASLKGWTTHMKKAENNWAVENGVLVTHGLDHSWLMTEKQYTDFEVRLDYRVATKTNTGLALRAATEGDPSYAGMEIQITDDAGYKNLSRVETTGSLWDVAPAYKPAPKPPGEWNHLQVAARGREVVVELNGVRVLDAALDQYKDKAAVHPGLLNTRGHVGLQSHTNKAEFKEIFIRSLDLPKDEKKAP